MSRTGFGLVWAKRYAVPTQAQRDANDKLIRVDSVDTTHVVQHWQSASGTHYYLPCYWHTFKKQWQHYTDHGQAIAFAPNRDIGGVYAAYMLASGIITKAGKRRNQAC